MHTNLCVLIEISMEREMINFFLGGLVTALMEENYFSWNDTGISISLQFYTLSSNKEACKLKAENTTTLQYLICSAACEEFLYSLYLQQALLENKMPPTGQLIMPCIVDTLFLSCSTLLSVHHNIILSALMLLMPPQSNSLYINHVLSYV